MLYRIRTAITITQVSTATTVRNTVFYFPFCHNIEISKTYDNQTQTATITLPKNLKYQDKNLYAGDNPMLLRGDKVKIESGYYPNLTTDFEGYISKVMNNVPIEIKCEDGMYLLKQKVSPNLTYTTVKLKTLLKDMIGTIVPYKSIDADLGKVRIQGATIAKTLSVLRNEFGIYSFFKNGVLQVGLPFYAPDKTATFLFEEQIIENDLVYLRSTDVQIQVKGILINDEGVKTEKVYGAKDGDVRTYYQYGGTITELDRACNAFLEQMTYTGYYGKFKTFLEPKVNPGDHAILYSYKIPERKGTYIVKSVDLEVGVKGGRQNIELERRVL